MNGVTLTPREWSVAELIADGHSQKEIAARLNLRLQTIKIYLDAIYRKMERAYPELLNLDKRVVLSQWILCHRCREPRPSPEVI